MIVITWLIYRKTTVNQCSSVPDDFQNAMGTFMVTIQLWWNTHEAERQTGKRRVKHNLFGKGKCIRHVIN